MPLRERHPSAGRPPLSARGTVDRFTAPRTTPPSGLVAWCDHGAWMIRTSAGEKGNGAGAAWSVVVSCRPWNLDIYSEWQS